MSNYPYKKEIQWKRKYRKIEYHYQNYQILQKLLITMKNKGTQNLFINMYPAGYYSRLPIARNSVKYKYKTSK